MANDKSSKFSWIFLIILLIILGSISFIVAGIALVAVAVTSGEVIGDGNVALISVKGVIMSEKSQGFGGSSGASSTDIVALIEKADENPKIEAILIEVNSPGGAAVASDEIASAISGSNKTTVSLIRDVGASGGYWVASSADHVVANRMSLTGSIGVIGSYLDFSGFIDRYNVSYQRMVAGEHKDMGSPFKEMTSEEEVIYQAYLDEIHVYFIEAVAINRNISYFDVKDIATGQFFSGNKALEYGLVDALGGRDDAVEYIENELNITAEVVEYETPKTFIEVLAGALGGQGFEVGQGIGDAIVNQESGVRT